MKKINIKHFMMLLTLAVGSSFQMQAKNSNESTKCKSSSQDSSFSDSATFHRELNRIEKNINNANDARKTTSESRLNMEFDAITIQIEALSKMTCDRTMREHHIHHLESKLAHVKRKARHYYSELSNEVQEKNTNESAKCKNSSHKISFNDSATFHRELDRISHKINDANDARKTTNESNLNLEFDTIAVQIKALSEMTCEQTMREHHIHHLENKLAHVKRKARHYYSELSK